jgi:hypothetical protein
LIDNFYNDRFDISNCVLKMFKKNIKVMNKNKTKPDIPGDWFKGPF